MRRAVAAVLAAGLCWTSVACTADPEADPPSTAPTATDPSTTTTSGTPTTSGPATTTPGEVKAPVMPALARENTRAGAKAFVRYYIALLNFGYAERTSDALRALSFTRCVVCSYIAEDIDRLRRRGGHQEGGDWAIETLRRLPGSQSAKPIFIAGVQVSAGRSIEAAGGNVHIIKPHEAFFEFHVGREANSWLMTDLRLG